MTDKSQVSLLYKRQKMMERIASALAFSMDPKQRLQVVMQVILDMFKSDRVWLLYPCDPEASSYEVPIEATVPEYPGALSAGQKVPMDPTSSQVMADALAVTNPVIYQPGNAIFKPVLTEVFSIRSQITMAIRPKQGQNWLIGMHQCDHDRFWKKEDARLLKDIAQRISDALGIYIYQQQLIESEERFRQVAESSRAVIWECNSDFKYTYMSPVIESLLGYKPDEMIGKHYLSFLPDSDLEQVKKTIALFNHENSEFKDFEFRIIARDGSVRHASASGKVIFDDHKNIKCVRGITQDITDRKQAADTLHEAYSLQQTILESTADGILVVDNDRNIRSFNTKFQEIWGIPEKILSHNDHRFFTAFTSAMFDDSELYESRINQIYSNNSVESHDLLFFHDGRIIERYSYPHRRKGMTVGRVWSFRDITESHKLTKQLSYEASHDALTGLLNRREFEKCLTQLIKNDRDQKSEHALCYLDLDQFKLVNDTCGHVAGDVLLKHIVMMLNSTARQTDTIARIGGDEFIILMEHCTLDQAKRVANELCEKIGNYRFSWENNHFKIGVSIGLVPISGETINIHDLLIQADTACYTAKDRGGNRIHIHHDDDYLLAQHRVEMQWISKIEDALFENRFQLWVQRVVAIGDSTITAGHHEVLIRMISPDNELIPPGAFLPAAERYKITPRIDRWVVSNTIKWLNDNPDTVDEFSRFFINLSGHSLADEKFLTFIVDELKKSSIPPNKLCFEVTETAAITHLDKVIDFISKMNTFGCHFALDDFGSGLSSFAYLKNLPVDYLKIDGQFVKNITQDPIDFAMVKSINEIGQVMGKLTIAEFVENNEILEKLKSIGVNYAQGYGIEKPLPIDDAFISLST